MHFTARFFFGATPLNGYYLKSGQKTTNVSILWTRFSTVQLACERDKTLLLPCMIYPSLIRHPVRFHKMILDENSLKRSEWSYGGHIAYVLFVHLQPNTQSKQWILKLFLLVQKCGRMSPNEGCWFNFFDFLMWASTIFLILPQIRLGDARKGGGCIP